MRRRTLEMNRALISLLLLSVFAHAEAPLCEANGLQVFPAMGSVIPINTRIIVEGIGSEQDRVKALIGKELVLKTEDDKVTCKVLAGWKSSMNRIAVVLRPRAWLKPNRTYRLLIDEALPGFHLIGHGSELPTWLTGKGPDERPPKWIDKPAVSEGRNQLIEGKPIRYVKLRMAMVEESPAYLVVSLRRTRGSSALQTYFVPVNGGDALLGHDSCSGSFELEDGQAYRATVEGSDAAGNHAAAVPALEFHAPKRVSR